MTKYDIFGDPITTPDTTGMKFPYRCKWCGNVHDGAAVAVVDRYADCTVWRCPGCTNLIDDRPLAWGGSAQRIEHTS